MDYDKIKKGLEETIDNQDTRIRAEGKKKIAEEREEGSRYNVSNRPEEEDKYLDLENPGAVESNKRKWGARKAEYQDEAAAKRAELMAKYKGDAEAAYADREWDAGWLHPSKYRKLKLRRR